MIKSTRFLTVVLMVLGLLLTSQALAIPAHPGIAKVRQPDGTTVSIRLHGNEHEHFNTTADGYTILKNTEGYYVYATLEGGSLLPTQQIAHDPSERTASEQVFLKGIGKYLKPARQTRRASAGRRAYNAHTTYNLNNFRGLVILVEYKDKKFSMTDFNQVANDILNKENFLGILPGNPYTGSVRDYFSDMSDGQFKPQFDVVGPVKIKYSQYDAHKSDDAWKLMNAALDAADKNVNFRQYDGDKDGFVDLVYFIFAGNGSNYPGNDERLLWPHANIIYDMDENGDYYWVRKDNVLLGDCACSTELEGWTDQPSSIRLDGIGSIVHEFSHVLGLPDFYDTDNEESGGESHYPGVWDVMADGCYDTPVAYSLYERWFMGWAEPELIDSVGSYTLDKLSKNVGFRINSAQEDEFFLLENRQKDDKWNEILPGTGMMVYRVDYTNPQVWKYNMTNCDPSHNYYELLRAQPYADYDSSYDPFPGKGRVTSLTNYTSPASLRSWEGKETPLALINIQEDRQRGIISFDVVDAHSEVGILSPHSDQQSAPAAIFTPDGRQVPAMSRPGLYIIRQGNTIRKVKK